MIKLQEYREKAKGFSDLLTYCTLVAEDIVLQKDGSLLSCYEFSGIDTSSATDNELDYVTEMVSRAFQQLSTGFMVHVDAIRLTKKAYPEEEKSCYTDAITKMIDEERREYFSGEYCYSTMTVLSITYKPSYSHIKAKQEDIIEKSIDFFRKSLIYIEDSLNTVLSLKKLSSYTDKFGITKSELLSFIQYTITSEMQEVIVPPIPMYLDTLIGGQDVAVGIEPKIANKHIAILSIDGLPQYSYPMMFQFFNSVPFEFRFSTRFIILDKYDAENEIEKYRKGWNQQIVGFLDQLFKNPNAKANRNALTMREDAEDAKALVQLGEVGAGYISSSVIMMNEDVEKLEEQIRVIRSTFQSIGCVVRHETINAMDAYLSTLAGNSHSNIRRALVTTVNVADMLPLASYYTGSPYNPSPFFPPYSRPLSVLTTAGGSSPFWLNLHVGDLGHSLIFGPTGSGKSTLLALLVAQFKCYKNAHIYAFDKGMSLFPLCKGAKGEHYNIAGDNNSLAFAPLQNIDESLAEMSWAEDWVASLLELQNVTVLPVHRNEIHSAMEKLVVNPRHLRSLTDFVDLVQNYQVKEALEYYTERGTMGFLLDAQEDKLGLSPFIVFEIEDLMNLGDKNLIPVLMYIFHRLEKSLKGQPTLLVLDEAWLMLGNKVFREKIREWLKVLRKANCAVVLATQSLSDAKNSGIIDVLVESCPTKILLANPNATQEDQYVLYKGLGLNEREIELISREAQSKRDYYISTSYGKRLVQLALGAKTLAFVGASDKDSIQRINELIMENDVDTWQDKWVYEKTKQNIG